jgi:hypothetical protein
LDDARFGHRMPGDHDRSDFMRLARIDRARMQNAFLAGLSM